MASKEARKLLQLVADKIDKVLFEHGMEFAKPDDDDAWQAFVGELQALLYKHYADEQTSDEDFDAEAESAEEPSASWDEEEGEYVAQPSASKRKRA